MFYFFNYIKLLSYQKFDSYFIQNTETNNTQEVFITNYKADNAFYWQ
ncbi:hypothetical protein CHLV4139_03970 [Campylobacter helveticus]|nr:hypothetical protein [Campylobacter helveticus]MCR2054651.1 hypothetical protein [Campylobacter helveticus]